ncbi:IS5-like element ISHch3 family transposase [Hahella aquimaris]|uniref:IS5-like element ISHch3 family transposase n=1 Tax=Hahella sp. HNIBRBA332 TaxID=3015983 RepID=UPI00273B8A9B|nr:IS5-like element ISHch3 family transposase [Hahella sp. HNIBRBA332]WLQ17415.1 IS5-like element ISHch3 family transposase [Hahella sp. HNIBRBA332]
MDTLWEVPDELWLRIEPILKEDWQPSVKGGRPIGNWRGYLDGIIFRMRSGCQWNQLPRRFGDDATVHRWFQRWSKNGVMEKIWASLLRDCQELEGVDWEWQSADGWLGKKPALGGENVGPNPTDRGKKGTKKSLLVEAEGGPLGLVIAGANVNDHKLLEATLESIVVERPAPTVEARQHLCLDKGYDNVASEDVAARHDYIPHICRIGEEAQPADRHPSGKPRRWVVERTFGWLSKCRALLIRYDKKDSNYLGLLQLACGLLWFRRMWRLQGSQ